jgi:HEAT repeat protein
MSNYITTKIIPTSKQENPLSESSTSVELSLNKTDIKDFSLETQQALTKALDNLSHGDFQQRWDVAKILPKLGVIAINPLQEILLDQSEDLEIRWFALKILGEFQAVEVIFTLVRLLETTEEEELITLASSTFAKQGKPAIKALSNFLRSPSHKFLATKALAQIRSVEIVEPLLSIVTDEDVKVRVTAIEALSNFEDSRITAVLIDALKDPSSEVRKEAVISLGLKAQSHPDLDLTSSLGELLHDLNLEVCKQAAIALSRMKTPLATSMLFEVLKATTTPIPLQMAIIRCLAWMETDLSLEYLHQALFLVTKNPIIEIITVLGRVNSENLRSQAVTILLDFYYSTPLLVKDPLISQSLAYAWGQLGDRRTKKALMEMQKTDNEILKAHANAALKAI